MSRCPTFPFTTLRHGLLAVLMLALLATSVTMAVARGQVRSGTAIVICSGYGVTTLEVDENGNPIGPVHPCPDCLAGFSLALLPDLPDLHRPVTASARVVFQPDHTVALQDALAPQARGPPVPV